MTLILCLPTFLMTEGKSNPVVPKMVRRMSRLPCANLDEGTVMIVNAATHATVSGKAMVVEKAVVKFFPKQGTPF